MKNSKKIIPLFIVILSIGAFVFSNTAFALTMGDVNGDTKITASDARLALRASAGLVTLSGDEQKAADVNFDDKVTASDARTILRYSSGLINKLPDSPDDTTSSPTSPTPTTPTSPTNPTNTPDPNLAAGKDDGSGDGIINAGDLLS